MSISLRSALGIGILAAGGALGVAAMRTPATAAAPAPAPTCDTPTTPFCSSTVPLPPGWTGHRFELAQNYPARAPMDKQPWLAVDPFKDPGAYTWAVLDYFYQGNVRASVEDSFNPKLNKVRGWYNAPWQTVGGNGREPIHGLTRERVSLPGELGPQQKSLWNNYAVGFTNAPGGMMMGRIWANHGKPDPSKSIAPEGTIAAKLLFTTASDAEVPWMKGSPGWDAYIYADVHNGGSFPVTAPRKVRKVRLLQLDIAVKDKRSTDTGWFFGTFVYNGGPTGKGGAGWRNIAPVGLMWGNDPGYSGTGELKQTWLNPDVKMAHYGYQGRLNGPVDNPKSSCLSCHMTAQSPESLDTLVANLLPPKGADPTPWFQNIPSGQPFTAGKQSNDYSMQLAFGFAGFQATHDAQRLSDPGARKRALEAVRLRSSSPARGGME